MKYQELQDKIQAEIAAFPMVFAFGEKQLKEALRKLNAKPSECVNIGYGGIIKATDQTAYFEMCNRIEDMKTEAKLISDAFLIEAIRYELGNHEYSYTYDATDTIECLDLDMKDERTQRCFAEAKKQYLAWYEKEEE